MDRRLVFAPAMLAMNLAYQSWLTGALGGHAPGAADFTATVDATHDPYVVVFAPTKGNAIPTGRYAIAVGKALDAASPQLPLLSGVSKGPVTLSGGYVLAYLAAHRQHVKIVAEYGDSYASENTTGSAVVITTFKHNGGEAILVGFFQSALPTAGPRKIGCYREQYYIVDPGTFTAEKTRIGCPG